MLRVVKELNDRSVGRNGLFLLARPVQAQAAGALGHYNICDG